jgi:hypothetical protein
VRTPQSRGAISAIWDGGIDWLYHNMLITVTLEKRQEKCL